MLKMVLGDRIKAIREKRDWTQTLLAKKMGISKSVMSRIEAGTRPLEDSLLVKLVEILEVSSDYLLGVEAKEKKHEEETEADLKRKQGLEYIKQIKDEETLDLAIDLLKKLSRQ